MLFGLDNTRLKLLRTGWGGRWMMMGKPGSSDGSYVVEEEEEGGC